METYLEIFPSDGYDLGICNLELNNLAIIYTLKFLSKPLG